MRTSYSKSCKYCGGQIQLSQTPAGRWLALDGLGKAHKCGRPSNRNQPVSRSSKEDTFKDITFPKEFRLKGEVDKNRRRPGHLPVASQSTENRSVKRRSTRRRQSKKKRRGSRKLSSGQFLLLVFFVGLILLSLWFRLSM